MGQIGMVDCGTLGALQINHLMDTARSSCWSFRTRAPGIPRRQISLERSHMPTMRCSRSRRRERKRGINQVARINTASLRESILIFVGTLSPACGRSEVATSTHRSLASSSFIGSAGIFSKISQCRRTETLRRRTTLQATSRRMVRAIHSSPQQIQITHSSRFRICGQ